MVGNNALNGTEDGSSYEDLPSLQDHRPQASSRNLHEDPIIEDDKVKRHVCGEGHIFTACPRKKVLRRKH